MRLVESYDTKGVGRIGQITMEQLESSSSWRQANFKMLMHSRTMAHFF